MKQWSYGVGSCERDKNRHECNGLVLFAVVLGLTIKGWYDGMMKWWNIKLMKCWNVKCWNAPILKS